MASQTNNPYLVKSMNGVITIDDGMGTVIEDGIVTANELDVTTLSVTTLATNTIVAKDPATDCDLWSNNSGSTYIASNCTGTVSFGMFCLGNFNLGPSAFTVTNKNMNFCTATGMSGNINFGSTSATGSKIKLLSPTVECQAVPTLGLHVVNKTYADAIAPALLAATNIWTGISNTFNNVIYTSLISPITAILNLGSASAVTTLIQNSEALLIAQTPSSYVSTGLPATLTNNGVRFFNTSSNSIIDLFSSSVAGSNQSTRIRSVGGTAAANSGALSITSGSMAISAVSGTLGLYASNGMAITTAAGDINISATAGVVGIEGLKISGNNIQTISGGINIVASSGDVAVISSAGVLNLGGVTTNVNGVGTNLCVNGDYKHEFAAAGGNCVHDFHSCATVNTNDYDGRIICSNGISGGTGTGSMSYSGASHKFSLGGICFDKGNLTNGSFIQTFTSLTNGLVIAANSIMAPNIIMDFASFGGVAFGSTPNVSLTCRANNPTAARIILTLYSKNASRVVVQAYNANSVNVPAGSWGIEVVAIGSY